MRAQVADFGLARRDDEAGPEEIEDTEVVLSRSSMLDQGLTRVGAIVGTPMYMSPEQHLGAPVDPRTDQFSFCVALFEALYGYRPFDGETVELLAMAANLTRRRAPPAGTDVPGWLHRVCMRGLQPDREARFPAMDALLDEVERGRSRGRGRWLFVGAGMMAVAAIGAVLLARGEPPPPLCAGGPERMIGVWDEEVQARAEQAFTATNKAYAADAWSHARDEVDRYGAGWLAMHRNSCEATQVRGEQSAELMDLRSSCLADRLQDLRALTALFAKADATVVKQAVVAAQALPPLDACADAAALRERGAAPPTDQAQAVQAVQAKLAAARTLRVAGKAKDSLALANEAMGEAEALRFAPLVARARLTVGSAQINAGEHEPAVSTLTTAVAAKLATRDDEGLLDGLLGLGEVLGYHLGRDKEAAPWLALAEAVVIRMGEPPRELARVLLARATVDITAQRFAEAEALLQRSTALVSEKFGAADPRLTAHRNALGGVYLRTGKYAEAQTQFEQAVALAEAENGPNHPDVAYPLNNLALCFERQARYDEAITTLRRALGVIERTAGADHPNAGLLRQNIGGMLRLAGDLPGARAELDAGLKIMEAKLGPEHPVLGHALTLSGDIARDQGDRTRARADYQRSDDLRRKVLGEDHPDRSLSLLGLGRLALDEDKSLAAVAALEKALALMATTQPDPIDHAEVRFYLASALPAGELVRARSLATQARADFAAAGVRAAHHVREVDAWLAAHPG
jgi:tetratricopeptide (TPR) repeat protein